jgi:hypothetical protein
MKAFIEKLGRLFLCCGLFLQEEEGGSSDESSSDDESSAGGARARGGGRPQQQQQQQRGAGDSKPAKRRRPRQQPAGNAKGAPLFELIFFRGCLTWAAGTGSSIGDQRVKSAFSVCTSGRMLAFICCCKGNEGVQMHVGST